ncbi:helix-turn-helix domain-containing protein [Flavobacterium sp. W22_SRS_FK3]|uniref:helix-turn-helix domain-containing protein n=1 Tax=Flavobacterium sp. W22_SRS_FK3 TaxID=3240275 RepID=UPI003F930F30
MDRLSLLQGIAKISVFVSLLMAFFLYTVKTENKLANRLFAWFFIVSAIDLSGFFVFEYIQDYPNLAIFRWTICLLAMPLFYLYVLAVCYSDFRLKWNHLLHLLPLTVVNLVFIPRLYLGMNKEISNSIDQMPEIYFIQILIEFQYVFYIVSAFLVLKQYKEIYLENYANPSSLTYKYLFQMTTVFLVAHCLVALKNVLRYSDYRQVFLWLNVVVGTVALFITCWLVMKALNHPELFRGINSKLKLTKNILPEINDNTIEVKEHHNEAIDVQIMTLKKYMVEKEPFLDPSLTIQELANQIDIPVRDLSVLINHKMDQHFFDFVNEYRIQKAMNILKDKSKSDLTVLEILYEVGFNSKSSFNTSFKKYTNLTPTAYRNAS